MIATKPRLRRVEASQYLLEKHGLSRKPTTLAKMATCGGGPRFRHDGRAVLYDVADLDEYARASLSEPVASTSEAA